MKVEALTQSNLGKQTQTPTHYDPNVLFAITRKQQRSTLPHIEQPLVGEDQWLCHELSWLDPTNKPQVKMAVITIPCQSSHLVESKSLKLYLNGFNNTIFQNQDAVTQAITKDLSQLCQADVRVHIHALSFYPASHTKNTIQCMDDLEYQPTEHPGCTIKGQDNPEKKIFYTHLFRSYCPVTHQPDWATLVIAYQGYPIDPKKLLGYLIHFRHHRAFHEHCIEQIFIELYQAWQPQDLMVKGYFSRRGGIAIHPMRHTENSQFDMSTINFNR